VRAVCLREELEETDPVSLGSVLGAEELERPWRAPSKAEVFAADPLRRWGYRAHATMSRCNLSVVTSSA
jgi:hypothetical protein